MITVQFWELFVCFAFGWRGFWVVYNAMKQDHYRSSLDGIEYTLCFLIATCGAAVGYLFVMLASHVNIVW